jgi:hypothetical protein
MGYAPIRSSCGSASLGDEMPMKKIILAAALAITVAAPAQATGGFSCRTGGARPIVVSVGFGHVPGSPLILRRLVDNGRNIPVKDAQWWLDRNELRILLISPDAHREEVVVRAKRNGHVYDGSLWRQGKRRWVRCRES